METENSNNRIAGGENEIKGGNRNNRRRHHRPKKANSFANAPAENTATREAGTAQKSDRRNMPNGTAAPERNHGANHNQNRNRNSQNGQSVAQNSRQRNTAAQDNGSIAKRFSEFEKLAEATSVRDEDIFLSLPTNTKTEISNEFVKKMVDDFFNEKESDTASCGENRTDDRTETESVADGTAEGFTEVVGVRFKSNGKIYYFSPDGKTVKKGENVIVDTARGLEFGEVCLENKFVPDADVIPPLRAVVRIASEEDKRHHEDNRKREKDACSICMPKIDAPKLDMKLIDAQYTFDNSKLLFYFTSAGRVDFRELVKDLASVFRTRIELRQIGIRDEAKLMGGLGPCGRSLCCVSFLPDFAQVSIKKAKEQGLSLNSSKISGCCGRLMCCLRYENDV